MGNLEQGKLKKIFLNFWAGKWNHLSLYYYHICWLVWKLAARFNIWGRWSSSPRVSSIKLLWPEPRSINQEELDFCQRWARSHALGGTLFQAPGCNAVLQWVPTGWAQPEPFSFWAPSRPRPYVPISKALAGSAQDPFPYIFGEGGEIPFKKPL